MPPELTFEVKKYAMRQSKDGVILSVVIHPSDASTDLLSAPIGQQWIMALAPYVESPSASEVGLKGDVKALSSSVEGVNPQAERAIKYAHSKYADRVQEIREFCGVTSTKEFKTNPAALVRFHQWESINGFVASMMR